MVTRGIVTRLLTSARLMTTLHCYLACLVLVRPSIRPNGPGIDMLGSCKHNGLIGLGPIKDRREAVKVVNCLNLDVFLLSSVRLCILLFLGRSVYDRVHPVVLRLMMLIIHLMPGLVR